jgi:hypothetical protein
VGREKVGDGQEPVAGVNVELIWSIIYWLELQFTDKTKSDLSLCLLFTAFCS